MFSLLILDRPKPFNCIFSGQIKINLYFNTFYLFCLFFVSLCCQFLFLKEPYFISTVYIIDRHTHFSVSSREYFYYRNLQLYSIAAVKYLEYL